MAESKQQRRKRRPSTVRTYTPIHTLPLLATAAGLALVTTTTLFSFPTSTGRGEGGREDGEEGLYTWVGVTSELSGGTHFHVYPPFFCAV